MTKKKQRPEIAEEAAAEKAFQKERNGDRQLREHVVSETPHVKSHGELAQDAAKAQTAAATDREARAAATAKHAETKTHGATVLLEGPDGTPFIEVDVPTAFATGERVVTVNGVSCEHCAEAPDGRWIYRAVRF